MPLSTALGALILIPVLIALSVVDARSYRIPDRLSLPLIGAGLGFAYGFSGLAWVDHLIGAGVGFALPALFGEIYFRMRAREGLGLGDAKLMGAAGAWLGWAPLPFLVLIAAMTGLGLILVTGRRGAQARIPFGPPLALAFLAIWIWGAPGQPPLWR